MTSLSLTLFINAASCLIFGSLFLSAPVQSAAMLGDFPASVLWGVGAALVANGAHLLFASTRKRPILGEVIWFSLGDLAWWLVTFALIGSGTWITSAKGQALAVMVAFFVAALGLAQLYGLGLQRSGLTAVKHGSRIAASWLSLPKWVKIWLYALNAAFLMSPLFLPWESARIVLIGYLASGPLLAAFAAYDGGMSRRMGLGHLVPWVPMSVMLASDLGAFGHGTGATLFGAGLLGMIGLCLAVDAYDLVRWLRGERGVIMSAS